MRAGVFAGSIVLGMLACDVEAPKPADAIPTKREVEAPVPTKRETEMAAPTKTEPKTGPKTETKTESKPTADTKPISEVLQAHEEVGKLRLGMTLDEMKAAVPQMKPEGPPLKGDDDWVRSYVADKQRFQVIVSAPREHGPWIVDMITVAGKSARKTKAGIGIGATKAEVLRAYPTAKYDPYDAGREVALVEVNAGEGLFFILEDGDGRVVSIELGDLRPCAMCE